MDTLMSVFDQIITILEKYTFHAVYTTVADIVDYLKNYLMDEENYNGNVESV